MYKVFNIFQYQSHGFVNIKVKDFFWRTLFSHKFARLEHCKIKVTCILIELNVCENCA